MENTNPTSPEAVTPDTPATPETQVKTYKVVVDGQEMEVDEATLLKGYSHNSAAAKRMQEAAQLRQEAEAVLRMFKENPAQAFQYLGHDARSFAEQVIAEQLEDLKLTPEQKELREYKKRVEAYEAEQRRIKEAADKEQMEQQLAAQTEALQEDIIGSLEASGLPKTPYTVNRIIYYMQAALAKGFDVKSSDVMKYVKDDYTREIQSMLGGLNEDALEVFLGQENMRKVAKRVGSQVAGKPKVQVNTRSTNPKPKQPAKPMSPREWMEQAKAERGR